MLDFSEENYKKTNNRNGLQLAYGHSRRLNADDVMTSSMLAGREGERIKGEEREDRGRKYASHMNFQKFLTTKPLTETLALTRSSPAN